ncbi:MAG: DUF3352 domain-containing protein, partial [Planctomycetota bacterium]
MSSLRLSTLWMTGVAVIGFGPWVSGAMVDAEKSPVAARSFVESLPADTYLVADLTGIGEMGQHFDELALAKIWKNEEVAAFMERALQELRSHLDELKEHAPDPEVSVEELRAILGGRIGLALGGLTSVQWVPMPSAILTIEVPQARQQHFLGMFEQVLDHMPEASRLVRGTLDHGNGAWKTLGHEEVHGEIVYGFDGELFVAGLGRRYLHEFLTARHGEGDAARLVEQAPFQRAREKALSDSSIGWLYLNVDAFRDRLSGLTPDNYVSALAAIGVDQVHSLSISFNRQGEGSRTTVYLDSPGERQGLLKALTPGTIDAERLGHVPDNTVLYATATYDAAAVYEELMGLVNLAASEYLPQRAGEQLQREMNAALRMLPLDPRADLLEPLGAMASLYVALPRQGGVIPDVVLSVDVRDSQRLSALIDQGLANLQGVEVKETSYRDRKIHYASIQQDGVTLQPAFVLTDDRLMIASQVLVLKRAIQWETSDDQKTLAQTEHFRRSLEQLHGHPGELLYIDLKSAVEFGYNAASPFLSSVIDPDQMPFDAALLPSTEAIASELDGLVIGYSADETGLLFESYSQFGIAALIEAAMASVHWAIDNGYGDAALAQAMGGVSQAVSREPKLGSLTYQVGQSLQASGDLKGAIGVYTRVLEEEPGNGAAHFQRGYCYHSLGEYQKSIPDFQKASELGFSPSNAKPHA